MAEEAVYYLWQCGKCGNMQPEAAPFCPNCAEAEGASNSNAAPADKVGKITEAMMGAIGWSLQHGQVKPGEILSQAGRRGYAATTLADLRLLPPEQQAQLASSFLATNRAGATGTGITAGLPGGLLGFAAIPADVSAVIYFSLRTLSGISQSFGFESASETGQTILLLAFAYASRLETITIGQRRLENLALARYLLQNPGA